MIGCWFGDMLVFPSVNLVNKHSNSSCSVLAVHSTVHRFIPLSITLTYHKVSSIWKRVRSSWEMYFQILHFLYLKMCVICFSKTICSDREQKIWCLYHYFLKLTFLFNRRLVRLSRIFNKFPAVRASSLKLSH